MIPYSKYAAARNAIYKEVKKEIETVEKVVDETVEKGQYDEKGIRLLYQILMGYYAKCWLRKQHDQRFNKLFLKIKKSEQKLQPIFVRFEDEKEEPPMYY